MSEFCFPFLHKWTKWSLSETVGTRTFFGVIKGKEEVIKFQSRHCQKCGYTQVKEVLL